MATATARSAPAAAPDLASEVVGFDGGPASPSDNLQHVADSARTTLGAGVVLIDAAVAAWRSPIASGLPPAAARRIQAAVDGSLDGSEHVVARLDSDPRTATALDWDAFGISWLISAPLRWDDESLGRILAAGSGKLARGRGGVECILPFATQAALALAYGRLSMRTARLSEEVESLKLLEQILTTTETIDELGHELTRWIEILGVQTGGVMVLDEERGMLQLLPGGFGAGKDATASYRLRVDNPVSNSARVFRSGEPYISNEAQGDPGIMQDYVEIFHVERLMTMPLTLGDRRVGIMHVANKPEPFTPHDVYRARLLAPRFATALELGMSMHRLRRQQGATEVLVDLAMGIASGKDIFELMRASFERLLDMIETDAFALVPPSGAPLTWRRDGISLAAEQRLVAEALQHSSLCPEIEEPQKAGEPGYSTLFVPVRLAGRRIATIATLRGRAEPFVPTERDALLRLANLAAVGWATENYQRQRAEVAVLRERQRIADDLHDAVAQIMFAAQLDLDGALEQTSLPDQAAQGIVRARSLLLRGDEEIRNVIHQLSRPIRGDLAQRLGLLAESLEEEFRISIKVEIPPPVGEAAKSIRRSVADALVKTAQEAVINAGKHAGPCSVTVRLGISRRERLVLTILDDGIGRVAGTSPEGYGLGSVRRSLRQCGGLMQICSRESGTRVIASVSL